jgi:FolB domain-containing protein
MNPAETDCVHIEELEVEASIGVTEEERTVPQKLVLNITVLPRRSFSNLDDAIANAVDYSRIAREATALAGAKSRCLIETLADELASHLLKTFPLTSALVEVRKFVLPKTRFVSAKAIRHA